MLTMAIGANRRVAHAARRRLAVNAVLENFSDGSMAFAASGGNFSMGDGRTRVAARCDVVRTVAIGAHGSRFSLRDGARVGALQVCLHRADDWNSRFFRQFRIRVTDGAGFGDIFWMHRRAGLGASDQFVDIAVAARASGRFFKTLSARHSMNAFLVSVHARRMATVALYGLDGGGVRHLRNIAVTGRAFECTMNRLIKTFLRDKQRDRLAVTLLLQAFDTVTAETNLF